MPESSSSKAKKTAKSTSRRWKAANDNLPKAKQLEVKFDPVEHCKVTREMVLEDRTRIGTMQKTYDDNFQQIQDHSERVGRRLVALEEMKVVRAWPIYAALAIEAAAIVWLGVKLFGHA